MNITDITNHGINNAICKAILRVKQKDYCDMSSESCINCYKWLEEEYKPQILTDSEKEYLSAVIKPFRDKVKYITKRIDTGVSDTEFIKIILENHNLLQLPRFERRTMYRGMEICACYSLDNLGL